MLRMRAAASALLKIVAFVLAPTDLCTKQAENGAWSLKHSSGPMSARNGRSGRHHARHSQLACSSCIVGHVLGKRHVAQSLRNA